VLIDTKASAPYPLNVQRIAELQAAGIPIRRINSSSRYLHWKMMLFDGQNVVQFSGFAKHPDLNFPPFESYRSRAVARYNAEARGIDVIMYRITDRVRSKK